MSSRRHVIRNRGDVIRNLTQGGMIYRKLDARRVAAGRPLEALALPRRQPSVSGERPAAGLPLQPPWPPRFAPLRSGGAPQSPPQPARMPCATHAQGR